MHLSILRNKLKSQYGAMDRVLVTLLFVVVGIIALVSIESWTSSHKEKMKNQSENTIKNIINE